MRWLCQHRAATLLPASPQCNSRENYILAKKLPTLSHFKEQVEGEQYARRAAGINSNMQSHPFKQGQARRFEKL